MSDYFGPPAQPAPAGEWLPPGGASVMPAWAGGGPPADIPGPWPRSRPAPWLSTLLGAVAGLLVGVGTFGLLAKLAESGDSAGLLAGLVTAAAVAGVVVLVQRLSGVPSSVAAVVVAFVLGAAPMVFWLSAADGMSLKTMLVLYLLVTTTTWAACFQLGGTRGRPVFLAGALVGLWLLVGVLAVDTGSGGSPFGAGPHRQDLAATSAAAQAPDRDGDGIPDEFDPEPDRNQFESDSGGSPFDVDGGADSDEGGVAESINPEQLFPFLFGFGAALTAFGVISLLFGAVYLAAARELDRRELASAATTFQAVGITALLAATTTLAADLGDGGASILAVLIGGALLWTGTVSGRRLSSWLGVLMVFTGLGGVVSALVDHDVAEGVLFVLLGIGVLAVAERLLPGPPDDDVNDGDVVLSVPPAAPGGAAPYSPQVPHTPQAPYLPPALPPPPSDPPLPPAQPPFA